MAATNAFCLERSNMEPDKSAVTSLVQVERVTEQVSVIRLNRPDRLSALSFPMVAALHDA